MRPIGVVVALLLLTACGDRAREAVRHPSASTPGVRVSMMELHMAGGVPPRWKLTPAPGDVAAGRVAFDDLGCPACHAVQGESFTQPNAAGPELTGMGSHHPAGYFVESILNPDAVLVEGPGYIGEDGHSTMPAYPDATIAQLTDVVAYLQSLRDGGAHPTDAMPPDAPGRGLPDLPAPPPGAATSALVQVYEVKAGQLAAFEDWFRREGAAQFLAQDGVVSVDTYVDVTRDGPPILTVVGFRDDEARQRFVAGHATEQLAQAFDAFIGPHPHQVYRRPPLYRAPSLSAP